MVSLSGDIWIVSRDPHLIAGLGDLIEAESSVAAHASRSLSELSNVLDSDRTMAVFVDIEPDPVGILTSLESVIARHSRIRFIVLSDQFSNDLVIEAMNAGARHFVAKSSIAHELPRIMERLLHSPFSSNGSRHGKIITILSAGGGCGATTLAVNLGRELTDQCEDLALLVDMDDAYGAISSYLGLRGEFGLEEILGQQQEIDPQLIGTTALRFSDNIHAVVNPISINPTRQPTTDYTRLEAALGASAQSYAWTVVDAPRVSREMVVRLARISSVTLIAGQFSVKDVRCARSLRDTLIERGIDEDAMVHVLTRHRGKHNMISITEAQKALDEARIETVRNDFRAVVRSINLGKPLADSSPRSLARRDIADLARHVRAISPKIHADDPAPNPPARSHPAPDPTTVGPR